MHDDLSKKIEALDKRTTGLETRGVHLSKSQTVVREAIEDIRSVVERLREAQQELLKARKETQLGESWLQSLINTSQDAVISIDREGRIVLFNPAAERIFGYNIAEVQGQKVNLLMAEPYQSEHDSYIERYEKTGEAHAIGQIRNVEARRKNGEEFPIELAITEIEKDDEVHYAAFIRDISRRLRSRERLVESERLAAIGAMAAGVAHEIGNPLNGMSMTIQLLERRLEQQEGVDNSILPKVSSLRDEIRRLTALLDDFGSLARHEKYGFVPTCLATLCSEVTFLQQESLKDAGIQLEMTFAENLPDVFADKDKLKQALMNLFKNAAEAMPQGGTLSIRGYASNDHAVLEIADTGTGIDPEIDIFAPFFTTKAKGTGLGLMLTRKIVSDHGGTISYTSETDQGTVFRIGLPHHETSP